MLEAGQEAWAPVRRLRSPAEASRQEEVVQVRVVQVWVEQARVPTAQEDLPDQSQGVPSPVDEVSSLRDEVSNRRDEDVSSHRGAEVSSRRGAEVSSHRGAEVSSRRDGEVSSRLEEAASRRDEDPIRVAAVLLVPSQVAEALSGPIPQVVVAPTLRAAVDPIHRAVGALSGPILPVAEDPSLLAAEDPNPVDPCRAEVHHCPAVPWGVGSSADPLLVPFPHRDTAEGAA